MSTAPRKFRDVSAQRVLFICVTGGSGRAQLGGAERFLAEMLPALATSSRSVYAIVSDKRVAKCLVERGVRVIERRPEKRFDLRYASDLYRAIVALRPDVVSVHLLSAAMHVRFLQLVTDVHKGKLIVTLHNSMRQYLSEAKGLSKVPVLKNTILERVFRALVSHDSVAVSMFEKEELDSVPNRGRVHLIYNALPAQWDVLKRRTISEARRALGLSESGRLILFIGRLEREKGADLLGPLSELLPQGYRLLVVGDGTIEPEGANIVRFSHTRSPELFYDAADAVVVPSRVESFGRVAIEAIASGVPVVHTGVGGLAEVLSGVDPMVCAVSRPEPSLLLLALESVIGGASKYPERMDQSASEIRERFGFRRMVADWSRLLNASS